MTLCPDVPPPGWTRVCATCHRMWPLAQFELIKDPRPGSTINRRRTCHPCMEQVRDSLRRDVAPAQIRRETGMSEKLIASIRHELGIPSPVRHRLQDEDLLVELTLTARWDTARIGDAVGIPAAQVRRHQRRLGIAPDTRSRPMPLPAETLALAHRLLEDRSGYAEAARTVGAHVSTIRAHFPGMGWTRDDFSGMTELRLALRNNPELRALHEEIARTEAA